jgi:signal transduction histidine kinase
MAPLRLLLDQMPTPLVGIEGKSARALNRAARTLFAAQDRIAPVPPAMLAPTMARMIHAGRHWRIDRVEAGGTVGARTILALIDIEAEERSGEARAAAEMIHVMGHELLNGLAPIVSLAESGLAAWGQDEARRAQLMPEILATLARRAESLQRFTEAYRALARLPDPALADMVATAFLGDMALLFAGHWQGRVALRMQPPPVSTSFRGTAISSPRPSGRCCKMPRRPRWPERRRHGWR